MAKIIINNNIKVNGNLTISRRKMTDEKGEEYLINEGQLRTHLYFENIESIKSMRMDINGVDVVEEVIGSDDYLMTYNFTFEELDFSGAFIKDVEAYSFLSLEEMSTVEKIMFKNDHNILGGIGEEYKALEFNNEKAEDTAEE